MSAVQILLLRLLDLALAAENTAVSNGLANLVRREDAVHMEDAALTDIDRVVGDHHLGVFWDGKQATVVNLQPTVDAELHIEGKVHFTCLAHTDSATAENWWVAVLGHGVPLATGTDLQCAINTNGECGDNASGTIADDLRVLAEAVAAGAGSGKGDFLDDSCQGDGNAVSQRLAVDAAGFSAWGRCCELEWPPEVRGLVAETSVPPAAVAHLNLRGDCGDIWCGEPFGCLLDRWQLALGEDAELDRTGVGGAVAESE